MQTEELNIYEIELNSHENETKDIEIKITDRQDAKYSLKRNEVPEKPIEPKPITIYVNSITGEHVDKPPPEENDSEEKKEDGTNNTSDENKEEKKEKPTYEKKEIFPTDEEIALYKTSMIKWNRVMKVYDEMKVRLDKKKELEAQLETRKVKKRVGTFSKQTNYTFTWEINAVERSRKIYRST